MMRSKAKILIADDDPRILTSVGRYLERSGYEVLTAEDGVSALEIVQNQAPGLVVLDIVFSEDKTLRNASIDGVAVLRKLRERGDIPVLMLSGAGSADIKVKTLDAGADDYLSKPFHLEELVARIEAILRRSDSAGPEKRELSFHHMRIDPRQRTVWKDGRPVHLTQFEFDILYTLAQRARQVFTRERLIQGAGKGDKDCHPQTIDVHIRRLRKKLEDDPSHPILIVTVRGIGYRFEDIPA